MLRGVSSLEEGKRSRVMRDPEVKVYSADLRILHEEKSRKMTDTKIALLPRQRMCHWYH